MKVPAKKKAGDFGAPHPTAGTMHPRDKLEFSRNAAAPTASHDGLAPPAGLWIDGLAKTPLKPLPTDHHRKSALRREMRALLRAMGTPLPDVAGVADEWLRGRPDFQHVAIFAALPGEPDLLPLPGILPGRIWCFPRVIDADTLVFHAVRHIDELKPAAFGIREPAEDAPVVAIDAIDVFLCPGLAFDHDGGRLGRGRGYYDRVLAGARTGAMRVGVCFANQLVASTFHESHDIAMDAVICENGVVTPAE